MRCVECGKRASVLVSRRSPFSAQWPLCRKDSNKVMVGIKWAWHDGKAKGVKMSGVPRYPIEFENLCACEACEHMAGE